MQPITNDATLSEWNKEKADLAKLRFQQKTNRLAQLKTAKLQRLKKQKQMLQKLKSPSS